MSIQVTNRPGGLIRIRRHLAAAAGAVAFALTLLVVGTPSPAHGAFGIAPGSFSTTLSTTSAGGHPDLTTKFRMEESSPNFPDEALKELRIDLPRGFLGDPRATVECTMGQVADAFGAPCPLESAVGEVTVTLGDTATPGNTTTINTLVYNIEPYADQPAAFAFNALVNGRLDAEVGPDGEYRIAVRTTDVPELQPILAIDMTLWGVPADHNGPGPKTDMSSGRSYGGPSNAPRREFLSNSTACAAAGEPAVMRVRSWQNPSREVRAESSFAPSTDCAALPFDPTIDIEPKNQTAGAPSGYDIEIGVPQVENPDGRETAHLKDVSVTFPEGVSLSPSVAHGLQACTNEQLGLGTRDAPACPQASKIGTISLDTPLLEDPLTGDVFIGNQLPGNRYRILLALEGSGVRVKLQGRVSPDPNTGQITATFVDNPQLPFNRIRMVLKDGPQAPLANPTSCGVKTVSTTLAAWSGKVANPSDTFAITHCPPRGFAPTWVAGTTNPAAGGDTAFTLRVARSDTDQEIDSINADLPAGLLGRISRVPVCPAARAASATCGAESQIGTTTVGAGPGPSPFYLQGRVYLTEGYKGAPYGLAFVVPAVAGPYDLGVVNVRAGISVNRTTAELSVASDPLPRILEGIPLRIKDIRVDIDRPGFMVNPTSCAPTAILGRIASTAGAMALPSSRFQVGDCAALPLEPDLAMTLAGKGQTRDGDHPALKATLKQTAGQVNLRKAAVTLPLSLALEPDNAQALCKPQEAAARACPPGSIVGTATAVTPVLTRPLTGPVYFVEGLRRTRTGATRRTLPKLWIPLRGEVELDLNADTAIADDKLVTSFANIPDAPITSFELNIAGGKNGVIVISNADVCAANQQASGDYTGQSGKTLLEEAAQITPLNCPTRIARSAQVGTSVKLTVGGLRNGGRLSASGEDVRTTRRTLKSANAANLTVPLDGAARRKLIRDKRLEVKVSVAYRAPGSRRSKRMSKTLTLKYPAPAPDEGGEQEERRR